MQKNVDAGMELVEFTPDLADYSLNVAVKEHVIPGWLHRLGYPGKGDEAVAIFNEHVGVNIGADGSVGAAPITKGPHAQ